MSVINQMLKDVEKRSRPRVAEPHISSMAAPDESQKTLRVLVIALSLVVVALLIYLSIDKFLQPEQPDPGVTEVTLVPSPQVTQPEAMNEQAEPTVNDIISPASEQPKSLQASEVVQQAVSAKIVEERTLRPAENNESLTAFETPAEASTEIVEPDPIQSETSSQPVIKKSPIVLTPEREAENYYRQSTRAFEAGNFAEAIQRAESALIILRDFHQARILKLRAKETLGDSITSDLDAAINEFPQVFQYRQYRARLMIKDGDLEGAKTLLSELQPPIVEAPDYYAALALIAQRQKDFSRSADYYQRLLQVDSSRADWWFGYAVARQQLGDRSSALSAYQQAVNRPGLTNSLRDFALEQIKGLQGY